MIRLGRHVTQPGDQLTDVSIEKLHKALLNSTGEVAALQRRLQAIRAMDPGQYRKLKVSLPYLVCAQFHPKARKKENFLFTERFLIDIDHLSEHGLDMQQLRDKFCADPRVELMFSSPSGDGLKILFRINPKITDPAYYVLFYKAFCLSLEKQYHLGAALDHKTHDVSRCCFVSYDPLAYFNPEAIPIEAEEVMPKDSFLAMDQVEKEAKALQLEFRQQIQENSPIQQESTAQELPDEVLNFIKEKIGQKVKKKQGNPMVQPEELEEIMTMLNEYLGEINAQIETVKPIPYGRQLKIRSGKIWAEVNIFSGKRGVSIVGTTKTGSNREFCATLTDFLKVSFQNP